MANILTIDDDDNVRRALDKGLSTFGHKILQAKNGKEGLRLAFWRSIDIILLDISMPGMNGMEVLRRLKECARTQHIPVIMLTGMDDSILEDQAFFDYAENYIIKTASVSAINDKLTSILDLLPRRLSGWPTMLRW